MKYQKIVQASDRIFYLVEKQGSSYQGYRNQVQTATACEMQENS